MLKLGSQRDLRTLLFGFVKLSAVNVVHKESTLFPNIQCLRNSSFFKSLTQEELWKGVTSVSNAGKKRGRGSIRSQRLSRDLNAGQKIGEGKVRVFWPGLNIKVLEDAKVNEIKMAPPREDTPKIIQTKKRLMLKVHPLDRGWSGKTKPGKKIGHPDPVEDETFEDFETIVLKQTLRSFLTSTLGRQRATYSLVATGNRNGLIGFGVAKGQDVMTCLKLARKRASKRLITINLIDKHTINHDFVSEYGRTRLLAFKKPEGYGLKCHRAIKALCELIGIENIAVNLEGSSNVLHITRAFIVGLLRQKSYQEIADEKKLHLVEFRKECLYYPKVLASPEHCLSLAEVRKKPVLFEEYIMGNRMLLKRDPKAPFYTKLPSWKTYLKKNLYKRNHGKVKLDLLVKYGTYKCYLSDLYTCKKPPKEPLSEEV